MSISDAAVLFARSFVIGVAVAAPVGAMGVLCIQRTLQHGWRYGAATGAGIATADGVYAALAAFGVTALTTLLVGLQAPLQIAGGAVLMWLGWRAIVTPPAHAAAASTEPTRVGAQYLSSIGLTLTNPMTVMAFGAVFASAGLADAATPRAAAVATAGVAAGSLAWWLTLVTTVALMRHAVSDHSVRVVNRASGALVAAFGAVAAGVGILTVLG